MTPCPCGKVAPQRHHKYPQHKAHRKVYGWLLDEPFNIRYYCADCHTSHAKVLEEDKWDEVQFRTAAYKEGYTLPPPTKSFKKQLFI